MANNLPPVLQFEDTRTREVGPGIFIPFPDDDGSVKEDAKQELRTRSQSDATEPDENCDASLTDGLDRETLESYNGVRQWVMCRAWEHHRERGIPFGEAVDNAWTEVKRQR